jgi:AcrR family transcriptional regulator
VPSVTRPLRKDAERNRQRVMQAAREVFAERGLTASLDDIAHHADVGVGTVYRRFPDKEALIDALFEEALERFVASTQEALENPDPWGGLVQFFEGAVGMQAADRGLKEILLSSGRGQQRVAGMRARIVPMVTELVRRAKAAGVLRADVTHHDVPLINMMLGTVADAARDSDPDLWRRYLTIILDGLRADCPGPSPLPTGALGDAELDCVMKAWRPPRR